MTSDRRDPRSSDEQAIAIIAGTLRIALIVIVTAATVGLAYGGRDYPRATVAAAQDKTR
nr:hypothetical protein [uncultured Lichenicoccus sp.]